METFSPGEMSTTDIAQTAKAAGCLEEDITSRGLQIFTY